MPYKSEKIKLQGLQDRRRKLTDKQKEEIMDLYNTGNWSWSTLGEKYGVSKGTIGSIVSKVRQHTVKEYNKTVWKTRRYDKEANNRYKRNWRKHKQELYLKGELKQKGDAVNEEI